MSRAFRLLLEARAKLYESGVLTTLRLHHPVISVGNLTLGGTGKTPLVIALAEGLRSVGFRPVILSRGYGRISRGVLEVGRQDTSWEQWGDEPLLMRQRLGNIPVVVGANRYEAGRHAEKKRLGNIFLLDDGFQHRRLHRDVDIVTVDPMEWAAGEALLPTGPWREPKAAIVRAHAACVQDLPGAPTPELPIRSFAVQTEIDGLYTGETKVSPDSFKNHAVIAFAGIAKPERFFSAVESLGIHPTRCVRFRDHHHYSAREIEHLQGEMLITTEKDAIRLATITERPYSYLRISAKIRDFDALMAVILSRVPKP